MVYRVRLIPEDEGGYSAIVPALPGCVSQGETEREALKNVELAIAEYLEVRSQMDASAGGQYYEVEVKVA